MSSGSPLPHINTDLGRNAVELIVAIMALVKGEVVIVQTSLIGSILSNLLLVMGMCFFFGGLRRQEQFFNMTVAQTAASLLALAIAGIIIPTVFDKETELPTASTAALSRGTAVILLFVYAGYLYFQLKTHHSVFSEESQKVPMRPKKHDLGPAAIKKGLIGPAGLVGMPGHNEESGSNNKKLQQMLNADPSIDDEEGDEEDPQLSFGVAMGTLIGSTVLIAFCAEFLVDSINYVTTQGGISEEFLGLILLPIVGNAAEHATAVTVAIKDKMDLAIGVAVGSSMQVALFLIPLLVIIGWGMGVDEMGLSFDVFQVAVLFVSVLLVNYLIGDGKSHWLEGMLLMCLYVIIAVCSWCKSQTIHLRKKTMLIIIRLPRPRCRVNIISRTSCLFDQQVQTIQKKNKTKKGQQKHLYMCRYKMYTIMHSAPSFALLTTSKTKNFKRLRHVSVAESIPLGRRATVGQSQ